jgi:hypothetical protein
MCADAGDAATPRGHVLTGEDMHGRRQIAPGELQLTGAGRPSVRIAAVFVDHRHPTRPPARPIFSKAS